MRPADTAPRGMRMNMKTAVSTANMICSRYCRNAVRAPICIAPSATRCAPNHMTATVERLRIAVMIGIVTANSRPTLRVVSKRSALAVSNRFSSCGVRTKALITRTPARVSRMTWLIRSIFVCIARNIGMARDMTTPMTSAISGRMTMSSAERVGSVRTAMMIPPTMRIGAETITVRPMNTTVWTCWTSLVLRVMSDGAPKWLTSTWENVSTVEKTARRTSRPNPIATRAPMNTAATEATPRTAVTTSIRAPTRRM